MKTLLVPTEQHDSMTSVLETALMIARKFDSYIEGFALRYDLKEFIAMDPVSGVAMDSVRQNEEEAAQQARDLFHNFMRDRTIKPAEGAAGTLSFGWSEQAPVGDSVIGSYGRVFDLIVLARPGSGVRGPRMAPLEAALFESGRPILVAPPAAPQKMGDNVLIDWNCSTEQAGTTALAMPLLAGAKQVTVLVVQGGTVPGPTGEQFVTYLARNGVKADLKTVGPVGGNRGEVILTEAQTLGCDLLIKGAYTQSRFRQMIFGGATRHILAHAAIPVFMAY